MRYREKNLKKICNKGMISGIYKEMIRILSKDNDVLKKVEILESLLNDVNESFEEAHYSVIYKCCKNMSKSKNDWLDQDEILYVFSLVYVIHVTDSCEFCIESLKSLFNNFSNTKMFDIMDKINSEVYSI